VRLIYWAVILVLTVALILFAVSNRESVSLALWPLPFLVDLPLYLLCFASVVVGSLIGLSAAWIAGRGGRREARRRRRRIESLERELAATQSQLPESDAPGRELPARR
jgi:uncharacterized integral membrane protein